MKPNTLTPEDLEAEFNVTLPPAYKEILSNTPPSLQRPVYKDQPKMGLISDCYFLTKIPEIALLNRNERALWPDAEWTRGRPFPKHLFLIGSDNGDQFALNLRTIRLATVVVWRHAFPLGIWLPYAKSLKHYIRKCEAKCE